MWRLARLGELDDTQVTGIPIQLPLLFDDLVPIGQLLISALAIAREVDHPVYDCFYLALAEARGERFLTADARLVARLVARLGGHRLAPLLRPL